MLKFIISVVLLLFSILVCTNMWVVWSTYDRVQDDVADLSSSYQIALVLGTSPYQVGGGTNQYFSGRMRAVADLYHADKIKHIIVSGDNETAYYNEPVEMQKALIELGVPSDKITLDYAGFRTLDSVVRCHKVFGQEQFTIVTQRFHSYRAQFIAQHYGLNTEVFVAEDADYKDAVKIEIRELMARSMAILDLYILDTQPRFLGEQVPVVL